MRKRNLTVPTVILLSLLSVAAGAADYHLAKRVGVLPVFFVPRGERAPNAKEGMLLMRHLQWTQRRYQEMLGGRDTFQIAGKAPQVCPGRHALSHYRTLPKKGIFPIMGELLDRYQVNRFNCPYVFLTVVMNANDRFPLGQGCHVNGGYNGGTGICLISSFDLNRLRNIQSTIRHELGHAFGLVHVDHYRYDMESTPSIMGYNKSQKTNGFQPSKTPGILIPEDIRALAMNDRVFAKLRFDPKTDIPAGYEITLIPQGFVPVEIPGQIDNRVLVETTSPERLNSKAGHIVQGRIQPNNGRVRCRPGSMWNTSVDETGWATADITFPLPVTLTKVTVHSQHSGQYNRATAVRIEAQDGDAFSPVVERPLESPDAVVTFTAATARKWRFSFRANRTGKIVIRGLRFFDGADEIFPPFVIIADDAPQTQTNAKAFRELGQAPIVSHEASRRGELIGAAPIFAAVRSSANLVSYPLSLSR